jgi:hypothetical protein
VLMHTASLCERGASVASFGGDADAEENHNDACI